MATLVFKRLMAIAFACSVLISAQALALVQPTQAKAAENRLQDGYRALIKNDLKAAEAAFAEALRLAPEAPGPMLGLAETAKLRNDAKGAEKWLQKALKVAPESAGVQLAWGNYLYVTQKFNEAEVAYKQAHSIDPKLLGASLSLGELYMSGLFKPKDAEAAFREAIQLSPDHAGAHNGLAGALAAQKRTDEAAAEFEIAARLAPDNPLPLHGLGRLYQYSGATDKALAAYGRALKVAPGFIPALLDRGDVYATKNQSDRALADYSEAVKRAPNQASTHFRLGMFHQGRNRSAEAIAAYRAAIKADPRYAPAYNNLAWLTMEGKGNLVEALSWAKKAINLQPGVPDFADTLGQVHLARGELDLAIEQFRRAADSKPPQAGFYYRLGLALAEKGASKEARGALKRAIEINKDFPGAAKARTLIEKLGG